MSIPLPAPRFPATHRWPVTLDLGPMRLRPMRRTDARAWQEVRSRNWEWLRHWEPTAPPEEDRPLASFGALLRMLRAQARDGRALPWVLEWTGDLDPRLIGQVNVTGVALGSARFAQIGYWIDEEFAGRGIVPAAVALACDYLFQVLRLHRIEIAIRPENAASLRVVEKLGFREEGPRPAYLHIDGAWRDHRIFALSADEVPERLLARCPGIKG